MEKKLRILFVVQSLVKGGAERLVLEICREIKRRDLAEVIIAGFDSVNEYPGLSEGLTFVHTKIEYRLSLFSRNRINLESFDKLVNDFQPDIIHTNCYMQEAPPREIIHNNITYFSHLHDNMPAFKRINILESGLRKRISEYYERKKLISKYRGCKNTFIAVSNDTAGYFKRNLPHDLAAKIVVMHNAIDVDKFRHPKERSICKEKPLQLINIGHFAPKKNQPFLLRVIRALKERNKNVRLTFIGDCTQAKEGLLALANSLGVAENIELKGLVNNVEQYLREADIYVHSATYEPFGLAIVEAMAAGLPVVSLDGHGNRDLIEEGKNGYMIETQDADLFAKKIIMLSENNELYSKISSYACEFAGRFDIRIYVDNLFALYNIKLKRQNI